MTERLQQYVEAIKTANQNWTGEGVDALGEMTVIVPRGSIVHLCLFMKREQGFDMLADLCGVDRGPEEDPRFELNYHLFSTIHHDRIRLKVLLSEDDAKVQSVTGVWRTADWHERETFD